MTEHDPTDPTNLPIFGGAGRPSETPAKPRPAARNLAGPIGGTPAADGQEPEPLPEAPAIPRDPAPPGGIDWQHVAALRSQASDQLTAALGAERGEDEEAEREIGRAIIQELLQSEAAERLSSGEQAWSLAEQDAIAQAVFDALFGFGRFQPLLEDEDIENVIGLGCDNVWADKADGSKMRLDPIADSDEELIDFLKFIDSREPNPRNFDQARPSLHMKLGERARLAATAWVTERPTVVIRRHNLHKVSLDDQVERDMVTPLMANFLRAAVEANKSIVIAGPQGAGKTTLTRALCLLIPDHEMVGTFETEYELFLHKFRDLVVPWEARPGSGEFLPDGSQAGAFTLMHALQDSFRFILSRYVVGEVRGPEAFAMLKAMESGAGSLSTTHAFTAAGTIRKLVSCSVETGLLTEKAALGKIVEGIDLIVQIHLETKKIPGGFRRRRWVSEIVAVEPGEEVPGYALTHVFKPNPDGGPGEPYLIPDDLANELTDHGFDLQGYLEYGGVDDQDRSA